MHATDHLPAPDWKAVRAEFPLNPEFCHFSQFFMVSHPRRVSDAIRKYRDAIDRDPFEVVERNMFGNVDDHMPSRIVRTVADYTGGDAAGIALVPNTTTGLGLLYHGLQLATGDEVLTTTQEHFTHHEAIRLATSRIGASWRRIPLHGTSPEADPDDIVRRLQSSVRPETRVLGISWVYSGTGLKAPVANIAAMLREVNASRPADARILLVVDGTHGLGAMPESVESLGCDFLVSSAHKWMFGPRGTGIIWGRLAAWARVQPVCATYSTWSLWEEWAAGRAPAHATTAMEFSPGGFIAYEHQWAMIEAFGWHLELGREHIGQRVAELNWRIVEGLAAIPGVRLHTPRHRDRHSGIICFDIDGLPTEDTVSRLHDRRIIASAAPYRISCARLSAGVMNDEAEIDRALQAVNDIALQMGD